MMQEHFHQPVLEVVGQHGNSRKRLRSESCGSANGSGNVQMPAQKRVMLSNHVLEGSVCSLAQHNFGSSCAPYLTNTFSASAPVAVPGAIGGRNIVTQYQNEESKRPLDRQLPEDVTMSDQGLPTPPYMAPRLAAQQRPTTGQTTVFSMGFRADCEKCKMKIPGHYSHIIRS